MDPLLILLFGLLAVVVLPGLLGVLLDRIGATETRRLSRPLPVDIASPSAQDGVRL